MGTYVDFISNIHKSTKRDYLARVNDKEYPKARAAKLAKKFGFDYWDGDRRICYGGYNYIEGRWEKVAHNLKNYYDLPKKPKILDIGSGIGKKPGVLKSLLNFIAISRVNSRCCFWSSPTGT